MRRRWLESLAGVIVAAGGAVAVVRAEPSAKDLVRQGNAEYRQGAYDAASERYTRAASEDPKLLEALFNRGVARLKEGRLNEAEADLATVGAAPGSPGLAASAFYNLGLVEQERLKGEEPVAPEEQLSGLERSASHFASALELSPADADAARNLELTRLELMKLREQMERQRQLQEQMKQLAEQLKQQQKEQEQQSQQSQQRAQEQAQQQEQQEQQQEQGQSEEQEQNQQGQEQGQGEQGQKGSSQARQDQRSLSERSEQAQRSLDEMQEQAADLPQANQQTQEARQSLDEAREAQERAEQSLQQGEDERASEAQKEAAEKLKEAAEKLSPAQQQSGEGQDKQESQEQQEQEQQQGEQAQQEQQQEQQQQGEQGQEGQSQDEATEQELSRILEKEERDKAYRRALQRSVYGQNKPVEKDW